MELSRQPSHMTIYLTVTRVTASAALELGLTDSDSEKRSLCSLDRWYLYLSTSIWISSVIGEYRYNLTQFELGPNFTRASGQYLVDMKTVRNATDIQVSIRIKEL